MRKALTHEPSTQGDKNVAPQTQTANSTNHQPIDPEHTRDALQHIANLLQHIAHLERLMITIASIEFGILAYFATNADKLIGTFEQEKGLLFAVVVASCAITAVAHLHFASIHLGLTCHLLDVENAVEDRYSPLHEALLVTSIGSGRIGKHLNVNFSWAVCMIYAALILFGAIVLFGYILNIPPWIQVVTAAAFACLVLIYIAPALKRLRGRLVAL